MVSAFGEVDYMRTGVLLGVSGATEVKRTAVPSDGAGGVW